jgi:hypothetical protein
MSWLHLKSPMFSPGQLAGSAIVVSSIVPVRRVLAKVKCAIDHPGKHCGNGTPVTIHFLELA